ncbi:MAG TPA: hypothetical protein VEO74_03585, partial [Thermoanaerobaculia bacterium]|nr:hypothetical protein [Thermoanaerobaculia bacterium]
MSKNLEALRLADTEATPDKLLGRMQRRVKRTHWVIGNEVRSHVLDERWRGVTPSHGLTQVREGGRQMQSCTTSPKGVGNFACQAFGGGPFFSPQKLLDNIEFHEPCLRGHPKVLEGGCGCGELRHAVIVSPLHGDGTKCPIHAHDFRVDAEGDITLACPAREFRCGIKLPETEVRDRDIRCHARGSVHITKALEMRQDHLMDLEGLGDCALLG